MIERFFRSLKEECVWQHTFQTFEQARWIIRDWVQWYNQERPHQALGYRKPGSIPSPTINPGGLISGEHYMVSKRVPVPCLGQVKCWYLLSRPFTAQPFC